MSYVARRTRSQTQKTSGSRPPAAFGYAKRRRRVARRNGGKNEMVVLSSEEDDNDKKKEEVEVVEGEEGQQSGFVGRSEGRKTNLGSTKKRRRIARRKSEKSGTIVLSSEEDDNDREEEVVVEAEEGRQSGFVGRNVGMKWNMRLGKGRAEASIRGFCLEEVACSASVRKSVPSCCRRKRGVIYVSGDHDGCKEKKLVGSKGISRRMQVETKISADREFHWSNEFVGAKRNVAVRKARQRQRLKKNNSTINQEKRKKNLSGRQIKVDEEASVAAFEEESNSKDKSDHDESNDDEFEKDESDDESDHVEGDNDEFQVGESEQETDDEDESIHNRSVGDNVTNDDSNHHATSARRREIAVKEEMRISSDANMSQEDEKDGVDDHALGNVDEEEMQQGIEEEEIGRQKRWVLQRENQIIQKKEIKKCMEKETHGRTSKQGVSVATKCIFNGKITNDSSMERSLRCPFSVRNNGAQSDAGDHVKKEASNAEAKVAEDRTDDPSDATDEDVKCRLLNNCVARRTRSNFERTPIGKFGSFSKPICIDMNDSPNPLVDDYDMPNDGSSSGHQIKDNGVPDHDGIDCVADQKGLANDFADVSSQQINEDLDLDDDGNDCIVDRKAIETDFADNGMETADIKISGKKATCFGDFLGDAGRVTDDSAEKGIREIGRKTSREPQCDYIDDDSSSSCEDDEDDESDGCPDIEINKHPQGDSGIAKTKNGSLDVSLFDLLVDSISQKRIAIPNDVKFSEGENLTRELPLWFSFRDLQAEHVKSETEEELDALWAELDFVLGCEAIGSLDWQEIEVEPKRSMLGCESKSPACQHQFVLDEQVGVTCRICSFLKTEIKHYMPPMVSGTFGKQSRKGSHEEGDDSLLDEFDCEELSGCSDISNDFTSGTVWDIIPELRNKMFQHQKEGFEFIWKNLAGGIVLDQLNSNSDGVGGCLISHAPGSGKTLLTIAFLQSFLQRFDDCRPMIVAPVNLLHIWEGEFRKWGIGVPLHMLNSRGFSGRESSSAFELLRRRQGKLGSTGRQNLCRIIKIFSWIDRKSVLLISYGLFRRLTMERQHSDKEGQAIRKILLEYTDLLVLDEGHTARNRFSRIWQCLKRVKTQRRIMLSGTPFQNNFVELFNTLYLIRPRFAAGIFERFGDPENGLEADPVEKEMSLQDKKRVFRRTFATFSDGIEPQGNSLRLKELRLIIDPFVHVHEGNLHKLPGLRDYFVFLYPSTLQRCILEKLTEKSNFENNYRVACVSVHPSILLGMETLNIKDKDVIKEHQADLSNARITDGVKVRFVVELVRLCAALGEKVLVFSQFVLPLSNIKTFLISSFNWTDGQEVLQLDGGIAQKCRQPIIHTFNNSQEVKVLLVSTEVCAEGMDLTGASRVVLLDLAWNPSVRRQAIGRAYRIGQKKVVCAYNLIASSTLEEKKHKIQDTKDKFSQLVFSTVAKNDTLVDTLKECDDIVLCELIKRDKSASFFEKVLEPKCGQDLEV